MVGEEQNNEGPAIGAGGSPLEPAGGTPASPPSEGVEATPAPDAAPPVLEQTPTGGNGENRAEGEDSHSAVSPLPLLPPVPSPEALSPPDRTAAAALVERFLGHQGSLRDATVAELNDDEVREVLAAGGDRHSAKSVIKSVISRAYDRRRDAAANEARDRESALRRSALAAAALETLEGLNAEQAASLASKLTPEQQEAAIAGCRPPTNLTAAVKGN